MTDQLQPVPPQQLPLIYVNAVSAHANALDAAFDVGYRGPDGQVAWAARLAMTWEHVLLLRDVLNQAVDMAEGQFGEIRKLQKSGHVHETSHKDQRREVRTVEVAEKPHLQADQMVPLSVSGGTSTNEFDWHRTPPPDLMDVFRTALDQASSSPRHGVTGEEFEELLERFREENSLNWEAVERARTNGWR